jgi:hypothetical protein
VKGVDGDGHTVIDIFNLPGNASTSRFPQALEKLNHLIKINALNAFSDVNDWLKKRFLPWTAEMPSQACQQLRSVWKLLLVGASKTGHYPQAGFSAPDLPRVFPVC